MNASPERTPRRVWCVLDRKPGHRNLARGLIAALASAQPISVTEVAAPAWLTPVGKLLQWLWPVGTALARSPAGTPDVVVGSGGNVLWYTADGQEGHVFKDVPYFTGQLSREMLRDPVVDANGVRLPSPQWRYLAYCYHLLFHDKVPPNPPGAPRLSEDSFTKPHYHRELERLASLAGVPVAQTFDDMERQLRDAGVMPSLDMIGFYSNRNPFLAKRYFNGGPTAVGLATFFVRDFGLGLQAVPQLRAGLLKTFEILAEGPVDDTNRERVLNGVRGSNWSDPNAPGGRAEPVYWFVCWDHAPRRPSARTRRKHPRVDNENIRLKDDLRREFDGSDKARRIIHSSDNSPEALEHLKHLGLDLDALRRSPPVC